MICKNKLKRVNTHTKQYNVHKNSNIRTHRTHSPGDQLNIAPTGLVGAPPDAAIDDLGAFRNGASALACAVNVSVVLVGTMGKSDWFTRLLGGSCFTAADTTGGLVVLVEGGYL